MHHTLERIKSVYPLSADRLQHFTHMLEPVELKKGHLLFREGKTCRDLYFIEKGIARAYCSTGEADLTFWFGLEGDMLLSYNGYINNTAGYETIALLEDAQLYKVPVTELEHLYGTDIQFANWGRKLTEKELIQTEERFISRQFKTAAERYRALLQEAPQLLQRVQLGYIASYLGITQVTLSRIRADMK